MRIVKPNAEVMKHDCGVYEFIEKVGRVCYKSENKIENGTAIKFVEQLAKSGHNAMLEHECLYFEFEDIRDIINFISQCLIPDNNSYNLTRFLTITNYFITGNIRAWIEFFNNVYELSQKFTIGTGIYETMHWLANTKYPEIFPLFPNWKYSEEEVDGDSIGSIGIITREDFIKDVKEICHDANDVLFKNLTHTVKFTVDRGISHELVRHRTASFAQSSTRFCNYNKGKYGNEITVIDPFFFHTTDSAYSEWLYSCNRAEEAYINLTNNGAKPEEARSVLPNSLMTEIIITATEEEWQHILNLRWHGITGRPHPQMEEVMNIVVPLLIKESEGRLK